MMEGLKIVKHHNLIFIIKRINLSSLLQLYHNKIIILNNSTIMFSTFSQELI